MRPKSIILLVGTCEEDLAVRRYMLDVRGYRVLTAMTAKAARAAVAEHDVRVAVVDLEFQGSGGVTGRSLVATLPDLRAGLRTILISHTKRPGWFAHQAHAVIFDGDGRLTADLVERCRAMCQRKRGPRPPVSVRIAAAGAA